MGPEFSFDFCSCSFFIILASNSIKICENIERGVIFPSAFDRRQGTRPYLAVARIDRMVRSACARSLYVLLRISSHRTSFRQGPNAVFTSALCSPESRYRCRNYYSPLPAFTNDPAKLFGQSDLDDLLSQAR